MPSHMEKNRSGLTLHDCVSLLYGLAWFLTALAVLTVASDWLNMFLHAPVGIKDNWTTQSSFVELADSLLPPFALIAVVLAVLRFFTREYSAKDVLLGSGAVLLWAVNAWGVYAMFARRPEAHYFTYIWEVIIAGILLAIDVVCAFGSVVSWTEDNLRGKIAGSLLIMSTVPALVAFVGVYVPSLSDLIGKAGWAVLLFALGLAVAGKAKKNESPAIRVKD